MGAVPARLDVGRFVVIGGGDDGAFHVRQLLRARRAGRLSTREIHVIDRDPACAVAREADPLVRLETAEWSTWLDAHLDTFDPQDQLVPYHWAPHLLFDWVERQARRHGAHTQRAPPPPASGLPFERLTRDGDRALSYAAWACPPACIEPALCPHTRAPKDWSLAHKLDSGVDALVLRCLHLVYGVGTIPVGTLLEARERVVAGLRAGPRRWLVATSSHCHALAALLEVSPRVNDVRAPDEDRAREPGGAWHIGLPGGGGGATLVAGRNTASAERCESPAESA